MYPLLTDDNTADEDLDKPNSLLISVSYTRVYIDLWKLRGIGRRSGKE